MESYGPPQVRALTRASRAVLRDPRRCSPIHRCSAPAARSTSARADNRARVEALHARAGGGGARSAAHRCGERLRARAGAAPKPRRWRRARGRRACDIDVHAVHQRFLRGARRAGRHAGLRCRGDARPTAGGQWTPRARRRAPHGAAAGDQRRRRLGRRTGQRWPARRRCTCSPSGAAPSRSPRRPASTYAPGRRVADRRRKLLLQARRRPAARLAGQRRPGGRARRGARRTRHRHRHRGASRPPPR